MSYQRTAQKAKAIDLKVKTAKLFMSRSTKKGFFLNLIAKR